jgi:hypothetical protein
MCPQPALTNLAERSIMGNFVVLEIANGVLVHYTHPQSGALAVKVVDRV